MELGRDMLFKLAVIVISGHVRQGVGHVAKIPAYTFVLCRPETMRIYGIGGGGTALSWQLDSEPKRRPGRQQMVNWM